MLKLDALRRGLLVAALALFGTQAHAQSTRTWVSGVGDDVNPCSRTAPCKTFAGAIAKTASGGEISVLDPGGFGQVTITKGITLSGDGTLASITSAGTNAIVVNCTGLQAACMVVIRNISINGTSTTTLGLNGVRFLSGGSLHLDNVTLATFSGHAVDFEPSTNAQLFMHNVAIRDADTGAVLIKPTLAGAAKASLDNVVMDGNGRGLRVEGGSNVQVTNSRAVTNTLNGIVGLSVDGRPLTIALDNVLSAGNGATGIYAGASTTVHMSNTMVTRNADGLLAVGGSIVSFGNNRVINNTASNGPPNATVPQM
jgi:hypothetical protein